MSTPLFAAARRQRAVVVLVAVIVLMVGVVTWASVMQIETRSQAMGQVIASERTQVIQASVDGVMAKLLVREGQTVQRNQLLAVLEQTQAQAAVNESSGKVAALQAAVVRYEAEMQDIQTTAQANVNINANADTGRGAASRNRLRSTGQLEFPKHLLAFPDFIRNQTELYERRRRALLEELAVLGRLRDNVQEELRMSEPLLKTGDISRVEILRLQKQVAELEGQIINRRNKYYQDAQAELTRVQEELRSQQQSLTDRSVNFDRTEIRAPAAGVVRNIRITTRGARVRPGDVMLDLLPTDGELVLEAKLKPGDIGHVAVGQPATVKLDAWDYSIYGVLDGDVIYISPDALNEDTGTLTQKSLVSISLGGQTIAFGDFAAGNFSLSAAMNVVAPGYYSDLKITVVDTSTGASAGQVSVLQNQKLGWYWLGQAQGNTNGGNGNDTILLGSMASSTGATTIQTGLGNDTVSVGIGSFSGTTNLTATVSDFTLGQDKLAVRGQTITAANLSNYLTSATGATAGGGTKLVIDLDGAGSGTTNYTLFLSGVAYDAANMNRVFGV